VVLNGVPLSGSLGGVSWKGHMVAVRCTGHLYWSAGEVRMNGLHWRGPVVL
jgi:hypothetical protein